MQVVITRDNSSIPWGFRLKGGAEYNVPLSILKVTEGSPSFYKLEVGDVIASIGSYPALNLKHEEALNIIRMFDVTLPLVIQREQSFYSQAKPAQVKTNVWRPPSVSSYDTHNNLSSSAMSNNASTTSPRGHLPPMLINTFNSPNNTRNSNLSNLTYSSYSSMNDLSQARAYNQQAPITPTSLSSPFQYQHTQSLNHHSPTSTDQSYHSYQPHQPQHHASTYHQSQSNEYYPRQQGPQQLIKIASPPPAHPQSIHHIGSSIVSSIPPAPPPPAPTSMAQQAYIPPAPPMPASFSPSNTYQTQRASLSQQDSSLPSAAYSRTHEAKETSKSSGAVPDALLKAMYGSPGGKKPFTYTPGGLDLSHIRDSARVKRYEQHNLQQNHHQQHHQQQQFGRQAAPSFENNEYPASQQHQSYHAYQPIAVAAPPPPAPAPLISSYQQPSFQANLKARSNSSSGFSYDSVPSTPTKKVPAYQPPTAPTGFNITPDKLVRPKPKEGGNLMNQSFSFRMLNRWIEESESNTMVSKKDEEENGKSQQTIQKSAVIKAIQEEETRGATGTNLIGGSVRKMSESYNSNPQPVKVSNAQAVPSKVFQYIDRALSSEPEQLIRRRQSSTSEEQTNNFVNRVPAREREQEPVAPKYKGTHIPSKSFKYLQYLTQNESVIDNNSLNNNYNANSGTSSSNSSFNPVMATHMQHVAQTALSNTPVLQTASTESYQQTNSNESFKINNSNTFDQSNYNHNNVSNFTPNVYSQPNHTDNGFNPSFASHTINKNSVTFAQNNTTLLQTPSNVHHEEVNVAKHEIVSSNSNLSLNNKDEHLVNEGINNLDESLIETNKESIRSEDECATAKDASSIELINTLSCESENPNSNSNDNNNNADNSESFLELPTSCTSIVNNQTLNTNINFTHNLNASQQSNETVEVVNNVETSRSLVVEKQSESQTVIQNNESSQHIVESTAQKETSSSTTTTANHEINEENVAEHSDEHLNATQNSDEQQLSVSNANDLHNSSTIQNAQEAEAVETSEF